MKRKIFTHVLRKLKRTAVLLVAAFALVGTLVLTANANGDAQVQVQNENTYQANLIKFKRVEYVGQCPGTVYSPGSLKGRFISSSTPPAPNRRVIIKNMTEGMNNDPYPYTNREYDEGQYSEGFDFSFGNSHKSRTFSVLEGENKFNYEIKESDKVIEQGTFTAEVSVKDLGVFPREVICSDQESCHDVRYDDYDYDRRSRNRGRIPRTRRVCRVVNVCRCP